MLSRRCDVNPFAPKVIRLDLWPGSYQPLGGIEHIDSVHPVGGHHGHSDPGSAVQIQRTGLGHGYGEPAPQLRHDRPHHRALLLQRADVAEQDVELEPADPHRRRPPAVGQPPKMDSTVAAEARDNIQAP